MKGLRADCALVPHRTLPNIFRTVDSLPMFHLTHGAALFHRELVTDTLRHPYHQSEVTDCFKSLFYTMPEMLRSKSVEMGDIDAGKILAEKAVRFDKDWPMFQDIERFRAMLAKVETALDEIEKELSREGKSGSWLCGSTFTAADICVASFLFSLYQV